MAYMRCVCCQQNATDFEAWDAAVVYGVHVPVMKISMKSTKYGGLRAPASQQQQTMPAFSPAMTYVSSIVYSSGSGRPGSIALKWSALRAKYSSSLRPGTGSP